MQCSICKENKSLDFFRKRKNGNPYLQCKVCETQRSNEYNKKNISHIKLKYHTLKYKFNRKQNRIKNQENRKQQQKEYLIKNKQNISLKRREYENLTAIKLIKKQYRKKNKNKLKEYFSNYRKQNKLKIREKERRLYLKKKDNPSYKLRKRISIDINHFLKRNKSVKGNISFLKFLAYSIKELKQHLESKFESWMTWENWGIYNPSTWDDNDKSTWTWQIDHIIPHSTFKYTNMEDEEFKKCWAFSNLRPYNAKQNLIEGNRR